VKIDRYERISRASAEGLPSEPGTYALLLRPQQDITLAVGRLGVFRLPGGAYAYIGSALGAGGIRGRVAHHLRDKRRLHWHIDAFTHQCVVEGASWVRAAEPLECCWVQLLLHLPGSRVPIRGFGSSDCPNRCPTHLVGLSPDYCVADVERVMLDRVSGSISFVPGHDLLKDQAHAESVLFP